MDTPLTVAVIAAGLAVCVAVDRDVRRPLTIGMLAALVLLIGLSLRQYRLWSRQSALLHEQTHATRHEQDQAAALADRTRIAREMQDAVANALTALTVQLEVAEGLLAHKRDIAAALSPLRRSQRLAAHGLTEARGASAVLRGDGPALPDALRGVAEGFRHGRGMAVDVLVDGEPRAIRPAAVVSLLHAAREALDNAADHAAGAPVSLALTYGPDRVRLSVRNPVIGEPKSLLPEYAPGREGGYGLSGTRERIASVGGTLVAGLGRDGHDWQVSLEVPNDRGSG
ncbi:sensor histidine kinase [Nocardia alni]|uniref:sensor histidine kinase n=1 Tax=Nocardia alni TaxID=2815723 RepID=UPI001C250A84|nr:histidine kinase [Nocardia alni]